MAKEKFYDKIRLGFGQSLMIGHRPDNLLLEDMGKAKPNIETSKFGLFEVATPNFHTYYPNVTAADLKPKEGDFVKPVFRALSEVVVHKKSNPIDFSMNNILKASMSKLLSQTIYANHEAIVGNELGSVSDVKWQDAYTTENGIKVPAGINAEFKIDAKSHPNVARAVMMDPPSIHSNSVTVSFAWEQSHPSLERNEFWGKVGTFGSDGQMIRRIVTDITGYHETSLVAHGADPFAQKVNKDGTINNPDYADNIYSLSAQGKEKPKTYFFSYKEDVTSLSEEESRSHEQNNINSENDMKDLIAQLALKYKKPEAEITEKFIADELAKLEISETALATANTNLEAEKGNVTKLTGELNAEKLKVTNLETEKTNLTAEVGKHKPVADKHIDQIRNEVKRTYNLIKGDKADAAKLTLIEKAPLEELEVSLKEYNEELEKSFPATCKDCNSKNVSRNTSVIGKNGEEDNTGIEKSVSELNDEIRNENKKGWIFDEKKA